MKLLLIFAAAISIAAAGSRPNHHSRHERDRRANLDYEDIETADHDQSESFQDLPEERSDLPRKSQRIGVYSIQVAKNKPQSHSQRRLPKHSSAKDSEASGTHYDGTATHYGAHYAPAPQVQQIHTHELLTQQALMPFYHHPQAAGGNVILAGGLGVQGLSEAGAHHGHPHGTPILVTGHPGVAGHHHAALVAANPPAVAAPEGDLSTDITKSVYVFSAPPDPFDVPKQHITRLPQKPQKHYQVLFINSPSLPQPQHHVELPPPPELKTLVYVLVKKPQPPPPISFIQPQPVPGHSPKPEVYFIRYKNRAHAAGLHPHSVGPIEEPVPVAHAGLQYAPIAPQADLRGNIDYGAELTLGSQYEAASQHHPYALPYQGDAQVAATHVLPRGLNREVDAGVSGI